MTTAIIDSLQALDAALRAEDKEQSLEKVQALLTSLQTTLDAVDSAVLG